MILVPMSQKVGYSIPGSDSAWPDIHQNSLEATPITFWNWLAFKNLAVRARRVGEPCRELIRMKCQICNRSGKIQLDASNPGSSMLRAVPRWIMFQPRTAEHPRFVLAWRSPWGGHASQVNSRGDWDRLRRRSRLNRTGILVRELPKTEPAPGTTLEVRK